MTAAEIKRKALEMGYIACGIIPANAFDEYTQALDERGETFPASKEKYASFYAMAKQAEPAKSVIVCTQRYNKYSIPESLSRTIGKLYLFDARVTYAPEYRGKMEFEAYLKAIGLGLVRSPVPARLAAAKAGIGTFGRNNFFYDGQHGSYVWIDTWVVDTELEYDTVVGDMMLSACHDGCNACIEACPTKALSGKLSMDISKCITRISTAMDGVPDEEMMAQMGEWIYGCDVCQDVCPANKDKFTETAAYPLLDVHEALVQPESILAMDEDTYRNVVNPRFWYAGEEALWFWKCSALRSMVNSGDAKYHGLIKESCNHEDTRIQAVAQWGCRTLGI